MSNEGIQVLIVLYVLSLIFTIMIWIMVKISYKNPRYTEKPKFTLWTSLLYLISLIIPVFGSILSFGVLLYTWFQTSDWYQKPNGEINSKILKFLNRKF
mgnify:CR=1 FL=1